MESCDNSPIQDRFVLPSFDQADPDGSYLKSVDQFLLGTRMQSENCQNHRKNKREPQSPVCWTYLHKFYTLFPKLADKVGGIFNYK